VGHDPPADECVASSLVDLLEQYADFADELARYDRAEIDEEPPTPYERAMARSDSW
jgi:hypothetical protein